MGLHAEDPGDGGGGSNTDFELIPAALHQAVCYGVVDFGTHHIEGTSRQGQKYSTDKRIVSLCFEFPHIRAEFERDGETVNQPRVRSRSYRLSLHEKADLRRDLESWKGKPFPQPVGGEKIKFDLKNLLGVNCQAQVMHSKGFNTDKMYANINTIMPKADGQNLVAETEVCYFSFEDYPEVDIPDNIPDWMVDEIQKSQEWVAIHGKPGPVGESSGEEPGTEPETSDIPF